MNSYGGNDNVFEAEEGPSKEKKPRIEVPETSGVSSPISSLAVENDNGITVESAEVHEKDKRSLLKGMEFSDEHIDAAIKACGAESDIIDLVEFIQAHFCVNDPVLCMENKVCSPLREGCMSKDSTIEKELGRHLKAMQFTEEDIEAAVKAYGKEGSVEGAIDYIQALHCVQDSSFAMEKEVDSSEDEGNSKLTPSQNLKKMDWGRCLKDMEFTEDHIEAAIKACGKDGSIEEAIDYIQALHCVQDSSFAMEKEVDSSEDEDNSGSTPSQKLRNSGSTTFGQVDSSDDEDNSGFTTFQKLRNMEFSSSAIQNAMETCESLDFEDLLNFLLEAESMREEDMQVEDGSRRLSYESKGTDEAGPSKALAPTSVRWTEDKIKLWYTYIGVKRDHFSHTYESSRERPWTKKPALEVKRGRKKKEVLKFQEATKIFRPEKMRGFAMPGYFVGRPKPVPKMMVGPPFFYFENVASAPKYEWDTIKRHLHDVEIEFTDSKFFSASRRPRGYVHNLPIEGRKLTVPEPPMTIAEALPDTQKYWPWWDTREKLNCINTRRASDSLCEMIRAFCVEYDGAEMPSQRQQEILQASKKWNLVWVGPGCVAPLEPDEIEHLLGFDKDHTRGFSSMTERYVALGNSFQVNTVAYHLSPLKDLYPNGMTVLSLFSGIGGAEVALHKSGIRLKAVVAVEKHAKTRNVLVSWWKKTGQRGKLNTECDDVKDLSYDVLARIIEDVGRIDLIIGGSPCNNLSGCNRVTRTGLEGKESSLFFEFPRILNIVKQIMNERHCK